MFILLFLSIQFLIIIITRCGNIPNQHPSRVFPNLTEAARVKLLDSAITVLHEWELKQQSQRNSRSHHQEWKEKHKWAVQCQDSIQQINRFTNQPRNQLTKTAQNTRIGA